MASKHRSQSLFVKDVIIGMSDGLTVPFALTAGLSGVLDTNHLIVVSGLAEIAAGCISMGLGGFLAGQSEVEHYDTLLRKEYHEIEQVPHLELQEVEDILLGMGVDQDLSRQVALQISQDKDRWADFMMKLELELEKPARNRAAVSAGTIAAAYLVGGFIPLLPYMFAPDSHWGLIYSCGITVLALMVFGYLKSKVTGQPIVAGTLKVTLIGVVAAAAAFLLARAVS